MNQQILDIITYITSHWQSILLYSVDGFSVAIVLQWLKKKFKLDELPRFDILKIIRLDGPRIVALLFTIFTGVSTAASWLVDPGNAQYIPERYAFVLMAGAYIHRFLVSPATTRIMTMLEPYLLAVDQIKKEQATTVPAPDSLPVATTPSPSLAPFTAAPPKE
jgi:hypothetical protein